MGKKTYVCFGEDARLSLEELADGAVRVSREKRVENITYGDLEWIETGPAMTYKREELSEVAAVLVRTWDRQRRVAIAKRTGG